jgi:hypothetical protein
MNEKITEEENKDFFARKEEAAELEPLNDEATENVATGQTPVIEEIKAENTEEDDEADLGDAVEKCRTAMVELKKSHSEDFYRDLDPEFVDEGMAKLWAKIKKFRPDDQRSYLSSSLEKKINHYDEEVKRLETELGHTNKEVKSKKCFVKILRDQFSEKTVSVAA